MRRAASPPAVAIALLALGMQAVLAQSPALPEWRTAIEESALAGSTGNIAVNNAAGIGNTQANMAVIGIGEELAGASIRSRQQAQRRTRMGANENAEIGSHAFRATSGIVAVNQSSGSGNAQANLVAIAFGNLSEVSIDQLARVSATEDSSATAQADEPGTRRAAISDSAFAGASGIVQVNQAAGSGNSSANVFALSIGVATP
jgi:hypothetical protein